MLSYPASSTILGVFVLTRPGIDLQFPGQLANTLFIWPMYMCIYTQPLCDWKDVTRDSYKHSKVRFNLDFLLIRELTNYGVRIHSVPNSTIERPSPWALRQSETPIILSMI